MYENDEFDENNIVENKPATKAELKAKKLAEKRAYNEQKKAYKQAKKQASSGGFKKFMTTVALAVVFGLVASTVFYGTSLFTKKLINRFFGTEETTDVVIEEDNKEVKALEDRIKTLEMAIENAEQNEEGTIIYDNRSRVEDVVTDTMPSIVAITNKSVQEVQSFGFYGWGTQQYEAESAGSGIIIGENDTEIIIVSNAHVVEGAQTLTVCFIDGEAYEAETRGASKNDDLAIVVVKKDIIKGSTLEEIKVAKLGNSDDLQIGEQVVAIGNALGYGQSVTTGIVSALNRTLDGDDSETTFIQTDAAINPGNSGGALLNMNGELIGINSAKLANTKIEGMGYAIPISRANPILDSLMNLASREKLDAADSGYLGIVGFSVTSDVAKKYGIPEGIYLSEVGEETPAGQAGLKKGDVIIKFDGVSIDSIEKLKERLQYYKPGERVEVEVARTDEGEYDRKNITVTLGTKEEAGITVDNKIEEIKDKEDNEESDADEEQVTPDEDENAQNGDGNKHGQFNFGNNTFEYSLPGNIFDFFR